MQVLEFLIACKIPFALAFGLTLWAIVKLHERHARKRRRAGGVHVGLRRML